MVSALIGPEVMRSKVEFPSPDLPGGTDVLSNQDIGNMSVTAPRPSTSMDEEQNDGSRLTNTMTPALPTRTEEDVIADLLRYRRIDPRSDRSDDRNLTTSATEEAVSDNVNGDVTISDVSDEEEEELGDESDDESIGEHAPTIPEQRRVQMARFDSFFQNHALQKARSGKTTDTADEEKLSTIAMVKQSANERIITTPREYQIELYERAKEQNIIAVLDTGSGKTLIAVLLLRHIINQELEDRERGKKKRISFFLVNSVTLVFQQYRVLEINLDHPMDKFCGEMGCDLWTKELWEKHFENNMVIVLTAEILAHCLHHGFISMEQINLLIFDEAHHAKKNHAYSHIIKDFYAQVEDKTRRPRVFGMTASPVDARVDVKQAAAQLEALLHCQIATPSKSTLAPFEQKKKLEEMADYDPLGPPFETTLYKKIKANFEEEGIFSKPLKFAKRASSELGAWCSDQLWPLCLTEDESMKLEAKTERNFRAQKVMDSLEVLEQRMEYIRAARKIVESHVFRDPELSTFHLSSKVLRLATFLRETFERPTDDKCIVFVRERYTARLLTELFSHPNIGTPHLRVGTLVGAKTGGVGDLNLSFRQQLLTMFRFRKGHLNCLFATSVAEEGLDIPDCNLIIRFDLYSTLIQYIQSRGRARHVNSKYVHMVEFGNKNHRELVKEVSKNEHVLRHFCDALPEDRLLKGSNYDMDYFLAKERNQRVYKEPETNAKLTYRMSLTVLENFVGSLPRHPEDSLHPEYVMIPQNKQFVCEVILPEVSPIHGAVGRPASTKQLAKCSAAFETCLLLRQGGYLDAHLLSTYKRQQHIMNNAALAINSKKRETYEMLTKPSMWSLNGVPEQLYLTIVGLSTYEHLDRPARPLGLLTRGPLPQFPQFPLFFGKDRQASVICQSCNLPINTDPEALNQINAFTLRIFDDVFSKEYEPDLSKMPYFLVPLKEFDFAGDLGDPSELIDWETVSHVKDNEWLSWDERTPDHFFESRFIVDPFDGSRKLWSVEVTPKYKPLDPVPPNTAPRPGTRKNNSNIMEYSCSLWAKSRARRTFKEVQPVIEAEYIPLRRNLLDDRSYTESQNPRQCFIIPEPLKISSLPVFVVAMAYVFPAIIHRLESYLIALDACRLLHLDIPPDLALEAMTKDSDNTEEHDAEQLRFQRGMGRNYERLEFIGDCFLKMATSISLYTAHPDGRENDYHVRRMLMICNNNLRDSAIKLELYQYIRSQGFNRRVWYPTGLVLKKGKTAVAETSHDLADKTVADVCEALIGAALLAQHKDKRFDTAVRAVTELVCNQDHIATCFSDYYAAYKVPRYQAAAATAAQKNLALQMEAMDNYKFRHPRLLRSAFLHPSYPFAYEHVPNYQRLEFLGDSLLDMACVNYLFYNFPEHDPQWLTEHKMAMVSNQFLGMLCVSLGFYKHLLQLNSALQKAIIEYVTEIDEARTEAEDEAVQEGKSRDEYSRNFWIHTNSPPKCLPDMVESYIGAIFVDSKYDFTQVERFFDTHIKPYFEDVVLYDTYANKNKVTFLHNFLNQRMGCFKWKLYSRQMPDLGDGTQPGILATVMVHNEIVEVAERVSIKYAKVKVAELALERLEGMSLPQFRREFHCDCRESSMEAMEQADADAAVFEHESAI